MGGNRKDRVGEEIRRVLAGILRDEVKDPRIRENLVSVTHVEVARDLRCATVYLSYPASPGEEARVMAVFRQAAGFIRAELAKRLELRFIPELNFKFDSSIRTGARINRLLKEESARQDGEAGPGSGASQTGEARLSGEGEEDAAAENER